MSRVPRPSSWNDRIALGLVVLALGFLLLSPRIKTQVMLPAQTVLLAPLRGFAELNRNLSNLRSENRRLSELAARLAVENARLSSIAALDSAPAGASLPLVRVSVIARDLATFQRYFITSRGTADRVRPGFPVITAQGVAGKVIACGPHQSLVQTLYATDSRVSVMDSRSRIPALVRAGADGSLTLDYIPKGSDVRVNDTLVTAGLGGTFPKGLSVGLVVSVPEASAGMFQTVRITPLAGIATLQEAFVVILPDTLPTGWLDNLARPEVSIPDQAE